MKLDKEFIPNNPLYFNSDTDPYAIAHKLATFLGEYKVPFKYDDRDNIFVISIPDSSEENSCYIISVMIGRKAELIRFGILLYDNIPDESLGVLSELITRLNTDNYRGVVGLFYEDRYCEYMLRFLPDGQLLSNDYFLSQLNTLASAHDKIAPAIKAVIENNEKPLLVHLSLVENAKSY